MTITSIALRRIAPHRAWLVVLLASVTWVAAGCSKTADPAPVDDTGTLNRTTADSGQDNNRPANLVADPGGVPVAASNDERPIPIAAASNDTTDSTEPGLELKQLLYPNGKVNESWYERVLADGTRVRHGPYKRFYDNGETRLSGQLVDGKRHGFWVTWFPNGVMRGQGEMDMEQKVGLWTHWDEGGNKRLEYEMVADKRQGLYTEWNETGAVVESGQYINDLKDGPWIEKGKDGERIEVTYRMGEKEE